MNICEHLSVTARLFPQSVAIVFEERRFTFSELDAYSVAAAGLLSEAGVTRGDRVAVRLPNVPAFAVWYYAALRLGAIAVSVSTRLAAAEVSTLLADCSAKTLVTSDTAFHRAGHELPQCVTTVFETNDAGDVCDNQPLAACRGESSSWVDAEPHEPAVILYTSGTTGVAKGATLSHGNVRSNVCAFNHLCEMRSQDRMLLAVPLFHCFGQNALLNSAFNVGATLVLQRSFDPAQSKRLIAQESVTQLYGVPTMFQLLHGCCDAADLASVRYCFSAAATLPLRVSRSWQEKFGQPIFEGYGLTETSPFASYNHRTRFLMGSIGTPIDCVEMRIVDTETGDVCGPGKLGEIAIRGPNVMLGYWNRPGDTSRAIRDGWFYTGDIGRCDDQGFFYIVDRAKDMISVGGLKVYPAEVERALQDCPGLDQIAVVGIPDDVLGEQVVAFVVKSEEAGLDDSRVQSALLDHARERLAHFKTPSRIVFVTELPRNPAGKVLKKQLRQHDLSRVEAVPPRPSLEATESPPHGQANLLQILATTYASGRRRAAIEYLQQLVKALAELDETPDADSSLLQLGVDSLLVVELSRALQFELGDRQQLPATLIFEHPRIVDLADFLLDAVDKTAGAEAAAARSTATRSTAMETTGPGAARCETVDTAGQQSLSSHPGRTSLSATDGAELDQKIASMTEDEVLQELMREIDDE